MIKRTLVILPAVIFVLVILHCKSPVNPYTKTENVTVSLYAASSAICELSASFSCSLTVGLPNLVDSITVTFGDSGADTSVITDPSAAGNYEYFFIEHVFATPGIKTIKAIAFAGASRPSDSLTVDVGARPAINSNGAINITGNPILDSAFQISVTLSQAGDFLYQWYKNDVAITGASGNMLSFGALANADAGTYYCIIRNDYGADTSASYVLAPQPATAFEKVALTLSINGQGTVTPSAGQYTKDTTLQLAALPDTGWAFAGWSDSVSGSATTATLVMNTNKVVTASFMQITDTPDKVALMVNINGNGTVIPAAGQYTKDTVVQLIAAPDSGWEFSGWSDSVSGTAATVSLVMSSDKVATATFTENTSVAEKVTLVFDVIGNGTVIPAAGQYTKDTVVQVIATPQSGWTFSSWSDSLTGSVSPASLTMNSDKKVTATFVEATVTYDLTIAITGNGSVSPQSGKYAQGDQLTLVATPDTGWEFSNWAGDVTGDTSMATIVMDAAKSVTANFTEIAYQIAYNLNGGINASNPAEYTVTTPTFALAQPSRPGYTFDGWYGNAGLTGTAISSISVGSTGDLEFWAKWSTIPYSITYNLNDGTNGANPATYTITTPTFTLENPTLAGHKFGGWYTDSGLTGTPVTSIDVGSTGDKEFWAKWTILSNYPVTYISNDHTSGTVPSAQTKTEGVALILAANTGNLDRTGHTFVGWNTQANGSGLSYAEGASYSTDAPLTLYAHWTTLPTYTIMYYGNQNTSGDAPANQTKIQGIAISLADKESLVRTGYSFSGWNTSSAGTGTNYAAGFSYTADAALTLHAKWIIDTFTVKFESDGGSAVADQRITYYSLATKYIPTKLNYTFADWYTTPALSTVFNFNTPITGPDTLYAKWNMDKPEISTHPQSQSALVNATVTFSVEATGIISGYQWQKNGSNISGATSTSYTTPAVTSGDNGAVFRCVVSNGGGSTNSNGATLSVHFVQINTQPTPQTVVDGGTVSFSVVVAANPAATFQWQIGVGGVNGTYTNLLGATSATLTFNANCPSHFGASYRCVASNYADSKTSAGVALTMILKDGDQNTYNIVKIGDQFWIQENLRATKYADGTTGIPPQPDGPAWYGLTTPAYCFYDNSTDLQEQQKWGALYNWYVVDPANPNQIAPSGWRVPTDADWNVMITYLIANGYNWNTNTTENYLAQSVAAKTDWATDANEGTPGYDLTQNNRSGFTALPGGQRYRYGNTANFYFKFTQSIWWSASSLDGAGCTSSLSSSAQDFQRNELGVNKKHGYSVRLVRE